MRRHDEVIASPQAHATLCDHFRMHIQSPCVVALTWRLEDTQGQLIDELAQPVEFFHGGVDLLGARSH